MPFQAEITPEGPQNIEQGLIKLNNAQVQKGFSQYKPDLFKNRVESEGLLPTTELYIG